METCIQVTALCLVAAVLAAVLRQSEMRLLLAMAVTVAAGLFLGGLLGEVLTFLRELTALTGVSEAVFEPLLKTVALALTTKVGGALCRDAGESALSVLVEMAGAFCAVVVALPLLRAVIALMRTWL